MSRDIALFSFF